jgi:hypothetical protein
MRIFKTVAALAIASITFGCSSSKENASNGGDGDAAAPIVGEAVFLMADMHWHRATATANATVDDLSAMFDSISPGDDEFVNISSDGAWYLLVTSRFNCESGECLAVVSKDMTMSQLVGGAANPISASGRPSIGSGGTLVVYPGPGGPHSMDLYATSLANGVWSAPLLLTMSAPQDFSHDPFIHPDLKTVVFECGPSQYQSPGAQICEVNLDGSNLHVVVSPTDGPSGTDDNETHTPSYAVDRSYVFEADWHTNETVWHRQDTTTAPNIISGPDYSDDNSPCVLPDGRILSLWLGRAGNTNSYHELKVMNADGSNPQLVVINMDITDVGIGCGK